MGKETKVIPCMNQEKYADCFSLKNGMCDCLEENDFPRKRCPFYKAAAEADKSNVAALRRLIQMDRIDLIRKYGSHRFLNKGVNSNAGHDSI